MKKWHYSFIFMVALLILPVGLFSKSPSRLKIRHSSQQMKNTSVMQKAISKDGTTITYFKNGSGPSLLLVHGTTADHSRWASISPRFEGQFTVYIMDRRGRGESGDSPYYDIMLEAEDVAAVIEAIGEPVFLLGHSYGGICCLEASLLTDKVSRLILYEPPIPTGLSLYPPTLPDRIQSLIDSNMLEAGLEVFFREVVKMPEYELQAYRQLPVWKKRIQLAPTIPREMTLDRTYLFEAAKFKEFRVPTLLLLGGESPLVFKQATELADSVLINSRLVVLSGQQHIAMDTNPDLFVSEVVNFLLQ
jgi:pimeloyl-ACP methyl ester carboxylesterase